MNDEAVRLDYARPARSRRRVVVVCATATVVALIVAIAFAFGGRLKTWASDWNDRRLILRGDAATGALDLTTTPGPNASAFLNDFIARTRPWANATSATRTRLSNLTRPMPSAGTGDAAVPFIGRLRASDGSERLATLGLNVGVNRDATRAFASFHLELFAIGTNRSPAFAVVQASLGKGIGNTFGDRHWITFDALDYAPGDAVEIGSPAVTADDPATIRLPIRIDGVADALRFKLKPGDRVSLSRESGGPLPIRRKAQPATTRSAA